MTALLTSPSFLYFALSCRFCLWPAQTNPPSFPVRSERTRALVQVHRQRGLSVREPAKLHRLSRTSVTRLLQRPNDMGGAA